MSREWDNRAEHQGGIVIDVHRRTVLLVFVASIALGAGLAWLVKTTFGL
jgi:hypothetical protein